MRWPRPVPVDVAPATRGLLQVTVEEDGKSKKTKKPKAEVAPQRTHVPIKVGEYGQEIPIGDFVPWWNTLVAETGGDGFALGGAEEQLGERC